MRNRYKTEIIEPPQDLIRVQLDKKRRKFFPFNDLVQILRIVVHYNVQIFFFLLLREEVILHLQNAGVFYLFEDVQLTIFILFILEDFFKGDLLPGQAHPAVVYNSKCASASHPIDLVLTALGSRTFLRVAVILA